MLLPVARALGARPPAAIDRTTVAPAHTALLRGVAAAGALPEADARGLATSLRRAVGCRPASAIVREGEVGDRFYVIASGEVEIARAHARPRRVVRRDRAPARRAAHRHRDRGTDVTLYTLERDIFVAAVTGHEPAHATAERSWPSASARSSPRSSSAQAMTRPRARAPTSLLLLARAPSRRPPAAPPSSSAMRARGPRGRGR